MSSRAATSPYPPAWSRVPGRTQRRGPALVGALVLFGISSVCFSAHAQQRLVVRYADGARVSCTNDDCGSTHERIETRVLDALIQVGGQVRSCYDVPRPVLTALMQRATKSSPRPVPDLTQCFDAVLPVGEDLAGWRRRLAAQTGVEEVYRAPRTGLVADRVSQVTLPATPPLADVQYYLGDADTGGLGFRTFWEEYGSLGEGIRIVDVEVDFNSAHEDLEAARDALSWPGAGTPSINQLEFTDHGTAAFGLILAGHNGFGLDGLAPGVEPIFVSQMTREFPWGTASAILRALQHLRPGDVLLLEVQADGPNYQPGTEEQIGLVPVEYYRAEFDAITLATNLGVVVVEAGGNGEQDLDDPIYEGRFDRSVRDSGAVLVCAGAPPSGNFGPVRSPLYFTNHGTRCDVQAYGAEVSAPGYGDLFDRGVNRRYTGRFGGTSSAAPFVAATAALLESLVRPRRFVPPLILRDLLTATGTPQAAGVPIGPLVHVMNAASGVGVASTTELPEPGLPSAGQYCEPDVGCDDTSTCVPLAEAHYCLTPCDPFGATACPDGQACQLQVQGFGLCADVTGVAESGEVCSSRRDCAMNHVCSAAGVCIGLCSLSHQMGCREGVPCVQFDPTYGDIGVCADDFANPDGEADGGSCGQPTDCQGGRCLTEWLGGYCTRADCTTDADCPGGGLCAAVGEQTLCLDRCQNDTECRQGYACLDELGRACFPAICDPFHSDDTCPPEAACALVEGGLGLCVEQRGQVGSGGNCGRNNDCRHNLICYQRQCREVCSLARDGEGCRQSGSFVCFGTNRSDIGFCLEVANNPSGSPEGGPCRQTDDCRRGFCFEDWPGGFCFTIGCESNADCEDGNACLPGGDGNTYCFTTCDEDAQCRAGYSCLNGLCTPTTEQPACESDFDCAGGESCAGGICRPLTTQDIGVESDVGTFADGGVAARSTDDGNCSVSTFHSPAWRDLPLIVVLLSLPTFLSARRKL